MNKISYRVLELNSYPGAVWYRVVCSCGCGDSDITLELEKEDDVKGMVFLNMYQKMSASAYYGDTNFFKILLTKLKMVCTIFFKGYIEVEGSTILEGKEHIDNFIQALEEGKRRIEDAM